MLNFRKIEIEDFYSIEHAIVEFQEGVCLIKGINHDVGSNYATSNGAGKTTIVNALLQGLYNKNKKDSKGTVESVNNYITGRPYKITIEFTKDFTDYTVINDRKNGVISIYQDGKDISVKGIPASLTKIRNIIGFSFDTFASLVYLTQETLANIFDITSKENIVYQFFDIDQVKRAEKATKEYIKDLESHRHILVTKMEGYKRTIAMLKKSPEFNIEEATNNLLILHQAKAELNESPLAGTIEHLSKRYELLREEFLQAKEEYTAHHSVFTNTKSLQQRLNSGICPVCKQSTEDVVGGLDSELQEMAIKEEELAKTLRAAKDAVVEVETKLKEAKRVFSQKEKELDSKISSLEGKIYTVKQAQQKMAQLQEEAENSKQELEKVQKELTELDERVVFFKQVLQIIKSGKITEAYLEKYTKLLNKNIARTLQYSEFSFGIAAQVSKGKLSYSIVEAGVPKGFTQLSSGERVRVAITLLIATLLTIEELSGVSINFVALDEIFGNLDKDGVAYVKRLLNTLRDTKAIFIIAHHDEVEEYFSDRILLVEKRDKITTISYKG